VAGDLALGQQFLQGIESFVYRKYLSFAEINEIKAMKRRIEQKVNQAGISDSEVKTGRGGIRDIEFAVQLLQLVHGRHDRTIRARATLDALETAFIAAYIAAIGEFVASVVLYTHANRPISIEILAQLRSLSFGTAAAYSVLLIALVLAITLGARLAEGRVERI